ncbi:uncharacterized protein LOC115361783 isoform X4 [Myripristis murdjan]|uniref:uncharacterized protein LOC115361783 isoform X4 n=1 Tax=Myripristis murdjan TaxID=586833 RepID=UPI001175FD9F|nr:uncharacterized protein LOC115361783 isoform X4 [Myripristis murdjan]
MLMKLSAIQNDCFSLNHNELGKYNNKPVDNVQLNQQHDMRLPAIPINRRGPRWGNIRARASKRIRSVWAFPTQDAVIHHLAKT